MAYSALRQITSETLVHRLTKSDLVEDELTLILNAFMKSCDSDEYQSIYMHTYVYIYRCVIYLYVYVFINCIWPKLYVSMFYMGKHL